MSSPKIYPKKIESTSGDDSPSSSPSPLSSSFSPNPRPFSMYPSSVSTSSILKFPLNPSTIFPRFKNSPTLPSTDDDPSRKEGPQSQTSPTTSLLISPIQSTLQSDLVPFGFPCIRWNNLHGITTG